MTTTIQIRHDGPDHHNVKVVRSYGDPAHQVHNETKVLKAGQSYTHSVYDGVRIECTETTDPPTTEHASAMNFGEALAALKTGARVARAGWNGKGMYLALVARGEYGLNKRGVGCDGFLGEAGPITLAPWIGMRTADAAFVPWLASQTDMLAEDWSSLP